LGLSATLLCFTHHLGALLVCASLPLWMLHRRSRPRLLPWIGWHGVPLALWAAYTLCSATQWEAHTVYNAWMAGYWETHSLALAPLASIGVFAPAGRFPLPPGIPLPVLGAGGNWAMFASQILVVAVLAAGLLAGRRVAASAAARRGAAAASGARGPGEDRAAESAGEVARGAAGGAWRWWLTDALFVFLPLIALLAASRLFAPAYVLGRSDAMVFPAFALLIGRGLARLPRWGTVLVLLFWTAVSIAALAPGYGWQDGPRSKGGDRRLASALAARGLEPSDWIVHSSLTAPTIEHYLARRQAGHRAAWFPSATGVNPAAAVETPIDSLRAYEQEAYSLRERIAAELSPDGGVWILGLLTPEAAARWPLGREPIAVAPAEEPPGISAADLAYPTGILLYALCGMQPQPGVLRYRQDWISGERVVVRVARQAWVAREQLSPIELGPELEASGASPAGETTDGGSR